MFRQALELGQPDFGQAPATYGASLAEALGGHERRDPASVPRRISPSDGVDRVLGQYGFRSSFRDWAAERTHFPRAVAEAALAHVIPDKVEAAYLRSDLFDQRRALMNIWAAFVTTKPTGAVVRGLA